MGNNITIASSKPQNRMIYVLFMICIIFQITVIKFMLDTALLSRFMNSLMFAYLFYLLVCKVIPGKYDYRVILQYILPGVLIVFGMLFNIVLNYTHTLKPYMFSYLGLVIPWLAYLVVPYWMKHNRYPLEKLWRIFYLFMLFVSILALIDWVLSFNGINYLRIIKTTGGKFTSGLFAIYFQLEDGALHHRMYAIFPEPGTYAMFLLPALSYAYYHKKFFCITPMLVCLYLTHSLGGYFGLLLLVVMIVIYSNKSIMKKFIFGLMLSFIVFAFSWNSLMTQLNHKGASRVVRVNNVKNSLSSLPEMIVERPFGLPLKASTAAMKKDKYYFGQDFTPINYFIYGGILSFSGYILILLSLLGLSIRFMFRRNLSPVDLVLCTSFFPLLSFIFQRTSIFDTALFALLFSPVLLERIQSYRKLSKHISCTQDSGEFLQDKGRMNASDS